MLFKKKEYIEILKKNISEEPFEMGNALEIYDYTEKFFDLKCEKCIPKEMSKKFPKNNMICQIAECNHAGYCVECYKHLGVEIIKMLSCVKVV